MCKAAQTINPCGWVQKDGEVRPGAKGISLSPDQFGILKGAAAGISAALQAQDTGYKLALSSRLGGLQQGVLWCIGAGP